MEGIEAVQQIDEKHLHFIARLGGTRKEWDAEITEQSPDHASPGARPQARPMPGVVTFHRVAESQTRIMLQLDYHPSGFVERRLI